MSQKPISVSGEEKSMFSPEDSPVSLFPTLEKEEERKMTASSGRICCELYRKSGPLGSLARMLMESERMWSRACRLRWVAKPICSVRVIEFTDTDRKAPSPSNKSAEILNQSDIPSNRLLFLLAASERPTEENECSLLPTVMTQGLKTCDKEGKTRFVNLGLLPTPTAVEGEKYTNTYNPNSQMGTSLSALAGSGMLPTPTARDFKNPSPIDGKRNRRKKEQGRTIELNDLIPAMLPTPRANQQHDINLDNEKLAQRNKGNLEEVVARMVLTKTLPTPTARDWKGLTTPGVVKQSTGTAYGETLPDAIDRILKLTGGVQNYYRL